MAEMQLNQSKLVEKFDEIKNPKFSFSGQQIVVTAQSAAVRPLAQLARGLYVV